MTIRNFMRISREFPLFLFGWDKIDTSKQEISVAHKVLKDVFGRLMKG
jgi:hypothetical protein